ncbi:putative bifunctional diguanylate cyclase/phosphodiesterase [Pseudomonas aeruginosa]
MWNRRKTGELYPEWLTISAVHIRSSEITHFVGVFADISTLKYAQARLDYQAHHDPLTGLPNRLLFESRLNHALDEAREESRPGAVLFIDLDRFKHINDSLGHPIGDLLLKAIAERLRDQLRDVDTVARPGGDEFIILLPGLHQESDAEHVARKLLNAFTAPFQADGHEFFVSASVGDRPVPQGRRRRPDPGEERRRRHVPRQVAGPQPHRVLHPRTDLPGHRAHGAGTELRRALERDELQLYYQPKLSLESGLLVGAEALVRWYHPLFGEISRSSFIPLAEDCGLILPLGDWVWNTPASRWANGKAARAVRPAVGQPRRRPARPAATDRTPRATAGAVRPGTVAAQLEITESFIMNQTEEALAVLHGLKRLGVQLAIDDFGTGYSSLSYLKRLPLDILKIDKSFIRGLPDDPHDAAITRAIIALGRSMQLTVIAEGVETEVSRASTHEGCEQIQGFVLSPPLPAELFASKFLKPRQPIGAPRERRYNPPTCATRVACPPPSCRVSGGFPQGNRTLGYPSLESKLAQKSFAFKDLPQRRWQ